MWCAHVCHLHTTPQMLRELFVFKVVPMLNPDGVIAGNYRCSLAGRDLNRNYRSKLKNAYPSVWHTKAMVKRYGADPLPHPPHTGLMPVLLSLSFTHVRMTYAHTMDNICQTHVQHMSDTCTRMCLCIYPCTVRMFACSSIPL